jgi:hypothetical protein
MEVVPKGTVSIGITEPYQVALVSALKLYHSLSLGRLDELHSMGAAAIIPAKNTTPNVGAQRMTPWPDVLVLQFRDALLYCMETFGHHVENNLVGLRASSREEVNCDLQRIVEIEKLIGMLESPGQESTMHSGPSNGIAWNKDLDGTECLQVDRFYLDILSQALEVYSRMGFAQLEMLAYYVDNGLIPMKKGASTSPRQAFLLCLKRMNSFKNALGYSEKESSAFDGPAVDRSTHLCFELLKELELHMVQLAKADLTPSVDTQCRVGRYTGEPLPRIKVVSDTA